MIVKKRFAPSLLISRNLVQFRVFFRASFFLGRSRFLPSLSRVARLHKKDRHLFEDASFQNGCGAKPVFASIYFVCFFLGFVIRAGCTRLPPVCHKDSLLRFDFAGGKILGL